MINTKNERKEHKYNQKTRLTVNFIVLLYVVVKFLFYLLAIEGNYWVTRVIFGSATFMIVFLLNNKLHLSDRAVSILVPFTLGLAESIICPLVDGDRLYFTFLMGTTLICFVYVEAVGMLAYIVGANIMVLIFAFVLRYPMMGPNYSLDDVLMQYIAFNIMNIFLYSICRVSVGKYRDFENTSRTYDKLMQNTSNFMIVTDEDTRVKYLSNTLLEWLGLEDAQYALGRPLIDLFASGDMKMMFYEVMESSGYVEKNFELMIDAKKYWFMLQSSLTGSGKIARFFEWVDITPLVEAKDEAEDASKVKSNFLAKISHEIRTPMNAVVGMSELILREHIPPVIYEHAFSIKQAGVNLLSIINDILDFSKIESGKLEIIPTPYLFTSLINDVISIVRMRLMEKPILFAVNVDCNIPNNLIGDEVRIRQVLLNLLGNAAKYTNEGFISIRAEGRIEGEGTVVLSIEISDSGIGIKGEDMDKLFGEFVQVDTAATKGIQGTGLGLAIAKNLCQAMGGDITVCSEYGIGSTFTITFPQKFEVYEKIASVRNPLEKRVLIYETRETYAESIVRTIGNLGVQCILAGNQQRFYDELKAYPYPFVFISSSLFEHTKQIMESLALESKIVLMAEFGEAIAYSNVRTIAMPVHAVPIANILNDIVENLAFQESKDTYTFFTAPSARVLIVDDVSTNLKVAEGLMAPYQMEIDTCMGGAEAIELVKRNSYDVIFMDHMMPGMDGIEAVRVIRGLENAHYEKLPIIALTANAISGVKEMFLGNGFHDFLAKPIETSKLNSILEQWVPLKKRRQYSGRMAGEKSLEVGLEIEGVDVKAGIFMAGGTIAGYKKILTAFYKDGMDKINEIKECMEQGDMALFTTYIHGIKGASAAIGAPEVSDLAKGLEHAGNGGDMEFIQRNTEGFLQQLELLLQNIYVSVLESTGGQGKDGIGGGRKEVPEGDLKKLELALENMDIGEANSIMDELESGNWDKETGDIIDSISKNILLFEYEEATALIGQLLSK